MSKLDLEQRSFLTQQFRDRVSFRNTERKNYGHDIAAIPRLLPMMMPKVIPTMLKGVSERVPMPDYMAEQMPELMPKVMDNLMPHMIGDVVPLITQPMIDYLRNKTQVSD